MSITTARRYLFFLGDLIGLFYPLVSCVHIVPKQVERENGDSLVIEQDTMMQRISLQAKRHDLTSVPDLYCKKMNVVILFQIAQLGPLLYDILVAID